MVLVFQTQSLGAGSFWGDTVDYEIHDIQPPSATQFGFEDNVTTSASVSTSTEVKKLKDIEIMGNNVIDSSTIIDNMALKPGDDYTREAVQISLKNCVCSSPRLENRGV